MKITVINGSPRLNGNSHAIVNSFCSKAKELGAQIKTYEMNKLQAKPCQACMVCKTKLDHCVIKDDLTEVFEEVKQSDITIISSAAYFRDLTAQVKPFIDRLYQLFGPNYHEGFDMETKSYNGKRVGRISPGKRVIFVTTQGAVAEEVQDDIHPRYEMFFRWVGFDDVHHIRGLGDPTYFPDHHMDKAIKQAESLAVELLAKK